MVNTDRGVSETWKFMMDRWKQPVPKMIISVIDDFETINMNRRLMKSIIFNLVKTATAEGRPIVYYRLCIGADFEKWPWG